MLAYVCHILSQQRERERERMGGRAGDPPFSLLVQFPLRSITKGRGSDGGGRREKEGKRPFCLCRSFNAGKRMCTERRGDQVSFSSLERVR